MKRKQKRSCCSIFKTIVRKCLKACVKQIVEFCRETGIHGCRYICETKRPMIERVVWAIMVLASVWAAFGMVRTTHDEYVKFSVLSVIESIHHGIWNYPFPAVTICDFNRVSLKSTQRLVDNLTLPSTVSKEFLVQEMKLLEELIYPGRYGSHVRNNLSQLQIIFDMNGLSIPEVVNAVTRDCGSLLQSCKWKATNVDCGDLFETSFTRDGMCCSFNYITNDRITKEPNISPHKMISCGYQNGLIVLLNMDPSDYHGSSVNSIGAKIMVHDSHDYPDYDAPSTLIGVNKYSFVTIQPIKVYFPKEVEKTFTKDCVHDGQTEKIFGDRSKRNFVPANYSFVNCLADCRTNVIRKKCGCIPYYYPQTKSRVCNLRDSECLETFKFWYDTSWPGMNISPQTLPFVKLNAEQRPCGCRHDCNMYRYFIEHSAGDLDGRVYYNDLAYTTYPNKGKSWSNQSVVHVFFGDLVSTKYRRDFRYSWRYYFATIGGVLGAFAGISFLSTFEIVYFLLFRFVIGSRLKRRAPESVTRTEC
ncbi:sodium channel protein Nach [Xylocopa sonorina]|uniref:sodium channel protein Nach n=1 Tax=Xylocopa sonorina TaxID=1818115 RepID=UPI00403AB354